MECIDSTIKVNFCVVATFIGGTCTNVIGNEFGMVIENLSWTCWKTSVFLKQTKTRNDGLLLVQRNTNNGCDL